MSNKKRIDMEITFIYNGNQIKEKEAYGYAQSLGQHKVNEWDLNKKNITNRQLADIAKKLDVEVKDLLDKNNEKYQDELAGKDYDDQDLLTMMSEDPRLIKTPILVHEKYAKLIDSAFDLNKLDMTFNSFTEEMSNKDEK